MPIVSTNNILTHRQLKIRSANTDLSLGKLVDIYCKAGLTLEIESLTDEEIEKLKSLLQKMKGTK